MQTELTKSYVIYSGQTKLIELADEVAQSRSLTKLEIKAKIDLATKIGLWLNALQYSDYLTKDTIDQLVNCLASLADVNAIPYAPTLTSIDPPNIINIPGDDGAPGPQGPEGGGISFSQANVTVDTIIDSFDISVARAAKWRYVIYGTSGMRVGNITGGWSADGTDYGDDGDLSTGDIYGNTTPISLSIIVVGTTASLYATVASGTWVVEGTRVYIPSTGSSIVQPTSLADTTVWIGSVLNVPTSQTISGDITITNAGVATIGSGVIDNSNISNSAAIGLTKLGTLTFSKAVVSNGSGYLTTSTADASKVDYLANVTSDIQAQINAIAGAGAITGAITTVVTSNLTPSRLVMSNALGKIAEAPASVSGSNVTFSGNLELSTSGNPQLKILSTSSGQAELLLNRTGATPSSWSMYCPSGSTNLVLYSGADLTTFSTNGNMNISGGIGFGGSQYFKVARVDIGDWNMDTTSFVQINHGLTFSKILHASADILEDSGALLYPVNYSSISTTNVPSGSIVTTTTFIQLERLTGGFFDNAGFNATGFNRGYITIIYIP